MKTLIHIAIIALFAIFISCERDFSFRGGDQGLSLSTDTVTFDTIFTSLGSVTKNFRVYNPYDDDLTIGEISLSGGDKSKFRININGLNTTQLNEIKIRSRDSLYIFVEVTIEPRDVNAPFIVIDSLRFVTQERIQYVKLIAYGQDVVLLKKEKLSTQTLKNDKPYLIYDYVTVDSLQKVTIEKGCRFHFHKNAKLLVYGELEVNGTADEPVVFEGDRLEDDYDYYPGQWGFIHFFAGSKNHKLNYAIIRNGLMGIQVDSVGLGSDEPMIINNSRFEHISSIGLLAKTSRINVTNTLFGDCGLHSLALTVGGHYEFTHCDIVQGYVVNGSLNSATALLLNNYYVDDKKVTHIVPLEKATFLNCIIYGESSTALSIDLKESSAGQASKEANYFFDHCLIKSGNIKTDDANHYNQIIANKNPFFVKWGEYGEYDYQLDTLSVAKDFGSIDHAQKAPLDFKLVNRLNDKGPDLGIYERVEKTK